MERYSDNYLAEDNQPTPETVLHLRSNWLSSELRQECGTKSKGRCAASKSFCFLKQKRKTARLNLKRKRRSPLSPLKLPSLDLSERPPLAPNKQLEEQKKGIVGAYDRAVLNTVLIIREKE